MSKLVDDAFARGMSDAINHFTTKRAGLKDWVGGAKNFLVGQPGRAFVEGANTFRPGGMLSHENIWWPSTKGLTGAQKVMPWLQRAGTMAVPFQLMSGAHHNPNEGTLSNVLGTAGSIAGTMYGMPTLGMLGAPLLGNALSRVGRGVGHLLGSRPTEQQQP